MKSSKTDKIQGAAHEVKGKVKEVVGNLTGDRDLENRGTIEKNAGKVQGKVGDVKKVFGK